MSQPTQLMIPENTVIRGRWRLVKRIGAGAFGEIYTGTDLSTKEQVAVKLEKTDSKKQVLKLEVAVLKKLQYCPHIARFIHCGRNSEYNYVVMELLGENLSELRRRQRAQRFSLSTTLKLSMQMLRAIQVVHEKGFLHRDVKPSNFVLGSTPERSRTVYIIDFGLARRYRLPSGEIRPPRDTAGFRGTARYASINSHEANELSRRDDLWSLFYLMVEFLVGSLPWRKLREKDEILKMKVKYTTPDLVRGLPTEMTALLLYLNSLQYESDPNYDYIYSLFQDLYQRNGWDDRTPYDWEVTGTGPTTAGSSSAIASSSPPAQQSTPAPMPSAPQPQPSMPAASTGVTPQSPKRPVSRGHARDDDSPDSDEANAWASRRVTNAASSAPGFEMTGPDDVSNFSPSRASGTPGRKSRLSSTVSPPATGAAAGTPGSGAAGSVDSKNENRATIDAAPDGRTHGSAAAADSINKTAARTGAQSTTAAQSSGVPPDTHMPPHEPTGKKCCTLL